MNTSRLELAASSVLLGRLHSDDLAGVAVEALQDGCDSPSLRILAGLTAAEVDEARVLFERALFEMNIIVPSKRNAVMRLALEIAKEILAGRTDAYVGAKKIWDLTLCAPNEDLRELDSFVYAASEWQDRPEAGEILGEGITAAARDLVRG